MQNALATSLAFVTDYLVSSRVIQWAVLKNDGTIRSANQALAECLKIESSEVVGQSIQDFLTEPDGVLLARWLSGSVAIPDREFLLNVVDKDQVPRSLICRLGVVENGYFLLAEPPRGDNQSLQEELLQLNNQLTVLSRENVRKGRELAKALNELKKTQAMLVHREKIASLGQMTAGIAHEINNPIAFVLSNEQVLKRDFDDLLTFVNALGDILPELATLSPRMHETIVAKAVDAGLEYLAEAIPRKLSANIEGLERVKKIVLDLRNFSRLDEAEQKYCTLSEGIESTLRFLNPLLKERGVTVKTDLAALPPLLCSPGHLNQAVSNVLANAIQASRPGQDVCVTTRAEAGEYCIEVADNGCGIAGENLGKVFDPFFTTKPVGEGTGLGLSIAHQIVSAHAGRIEIESRLGLGTVVRILLPNVSDRVSTGKEKENPHGTQ